MLKSRTHLEVYARPMHSLGFDPFRHCQHHRGRPWDDHRRVPSVQQPAGDGSVRDAGDQRGRIPDQRVSRRQAHRVRPGPPLRRFRFQVQGHGGAEQDPLRGDPHLQADSRGHRISQLHARCRLRMQGQPASDTGALPPRGPVHGRHRELQRRGLPEEEAPGDRGCTP